MTRSYCQNHISAYAPEHANCRDCDVQREDEIDWTRMRDEAIRERDEAQQMVTELHDALTCWRPCGCNHPACGFCEDDERVAKLLQRLL